MQRVHRSRAIHAKWVIPFPLIFAAGFLLACGLASARGFDEAERFVRQALQEHPRMRKAVARAAQARNRYEETYGFFDPALRVAAGGSDEVRGLPGVDMLGSISSEAYEVQSSLDIPFRPGFYLTVGLTERYYRDPVAFDSLYESLFGVGVRIPLLKDRGFKIWQLDKLRLLADYDRAISDYLAERQALRHDVETAYVALCESIALAEIAKEGTARFALLLGETEQLVAQKAIAQYQIHAARTELALSRSEELEAVEHVDTRFIMLLELMAADTRPVIRVDREAWIGKAAALELGQARRLDESLRDRGDYLAVANQRLGSELGEEAQTERLRGELSLEAATTWRGEDENVALGSSDNSDADRLGGHVMLVYQRPLGFRAEKSRAAEFRNRIAELDAELGSLARIAQRDLDDSRSRFDYARKRLAELTGAVGSAKENLAAEQERFKLGEGRSRNVLDAQKDITKAERAQAVAAARILRAWSDHEWANGYPEDDGSRREVEALRIPQAGDRQSAIGDN